jgi:hypothetical protein
MPCGGLRPSLRRVAVPRRGVPGHAAGRIFWAVPHSFFPWRRRPWPELASRCLSDITAMLSVQQKVRRFCYNPQSAP